MYIFRTRPRETRAGGLNQTVRACMLNTGARNNARGRRARVSGHGNLSERARVLPPSATADKVVPDRIPTPKFNWLARARGVWSCRHDAHARLCRPKSRLSDRPANAQKTAANARFHTVQPSPKVPQKTLRREIFLRSATQAHACAPARYACESNRPPPGRKCLQPA